MIRYVKIIQEIGWGYFCSYPLGPETLRQAERRPEVRTVMNPGHLTVQTAKRAIILGACEFKNAVRLFEADQIRIVVCSVDPYLSGKAKCDSSWINITYSDDPDFEIKLLFSHELWEEFARSTASNNYQVEVSI